MFKPILTATVIVVAFASAIPFGPRGRIRAAQLQGIGDPEQLKKTLLERMKREPPTYRGDNNLRLKWEWYDGVSRSYLFEKNTLVQEVSAGQPNLLRPQWVFRNIKVTFQDIFQLTSQDDDKLIPILSYYTMLANSPSATFEGLSLYGKDGELKGAITRKYIVSTADYPTSWVNAGSAGRSRFSFVDALEYKDPKTGKLEIASGNASDAVNLRWADIKDRIADDMSEEKASEDRRLVREAFAKSLKESIPDR
jgi:hypothetical protein